MTLTQRVIWYTLRLARTTRYAPLPRVSNENQAKNKMIIMAYYLFFFRRFWVKEPRYSENIFAKKRYTHMV